MLPRLNEGFDKHLDPFIKLCHDKDHRPVSALLLTTIQGPTEVPGCRKELEEHFKKAAADIHKIPTSMRFNNDHKSACEAIDALLKDIMVTKGMPVKYKPT